MEIDYADFIEVEMPDEFYLPTADLWCYGRDMRDAVPEVPTEISYTEEILVKWINGEMEPIDVVIPRSVWMDYNKQLTRTDYKPLDANNQHDPFDGKTGFVTQVNDFNTGEEHAGKLLSGGITISTSGLSYMINMDLGNCSVDYLTNDETGTVIIHDGHVIMRNPFFFMNIGLFAFNGIVSIYSL